MTVFVQEGSSRIREMRLSKFSCNVYAYSHIPTGCQSIGPWRNQVPTEGLSRHKGVSAAENLLTKHCDTFFLTPKIQFALNVVSIDGNYIIVKGTIISIINSSSFVWSKYQGIITF